MEWRCVKKLMRDEIAELRDRSIDRLRNEMNKKFCDNWDELPVIEEVFDRLVHQLDVTRDLAIMKGKYDVQWAMEAEVEMAAKRTKAYAARFAICLQCCHPPARSKT